MSLRRKLECAIEAAIDEGLDVDDAIALLDALDGDSDLEPETLEERDLPPLMDGGWGYPLGRLPMFDRCPCCGNEEFDCYVLPVIPMGNGYDKVWQ